MGFTIKEIGRELGISHAAVSQILNRRGRYSEETRQKVFALAAKRNYRPNSAALALRDRSTKTIGILFPNNRAAPLTTITSFEYLVGINERFQEADFGTLLIRPGELTLENDVEPRVFRERLVDGVIVVGSALERVIERIRALSQHVIWLDAPVWEPTCCIRRDEFRAGELCVNALVDLGYRHLTFVGRDPRRKTHHSHPSREAGAMAAARSHSLDMRILRWPELDHEAEYKILRELFTPDCGFVTADNTLARRLAHGASYLGLTPGHDFGLVSCDDNFELSVTWSGLSRASFDRYGMGEKAAAMMLQLLADPAHPPESQLIKIRWLPGCTAMGPPITATDKKVIPAKRRLKR